MIRHVHSALILLLAVSLLVGCGKVVADRSGSTTTLRGGESAPVQKIEQAPLGTGDPVADTGHAAEAATHTTLASDTLRNCEWRKCEIGEGPLACEGSDQVCDMYRNQCVPVCQGSDCCTGVDCPEGTVCVPRVGRCGIPVGQDCYDMGTEWWSGRDIPPDQHPVLENPAPAVFVVQNDGDGPLYFESTLRQPVRFDLHLQYCGRIQKLELAENHFCPTLCPDQGPAVEVDCGKPPQIVQCLPVGEHMSVAWSGLEQVGMRRICDTPPGQFCLVNRLTLPGTYTVEICAYTNVEGGQPDADDPNRLIRGRPAGERQCLQVEFQHPTTAPVVIRFGG